jgi:nicotinamidase-related amidase
MEGSGTLVDAWLEDGAPFAAPVALPAPGSALVVVDVQYAHASREHGFGLAFNTLHPGSCDAFDDRVQRMVLPTIAGLLAAFRDRRLPVVYLTLGSSDRSLTDVPARLRAAVRAVERKSGVDDLMWSGSPWARIRDEVAPEANELVVNKTTFGAFGSTNLEGILRSREIESLVFTGVTTSCCVETTARVAADLSFGCVLVDEGLAEYDMAAHVATLRGFQARFGGVVTTAADVIRVLDSEPSRTSEALAVRAE